MIAEKVLEWIDKGWMWRDFIRVRFNEVGNITDC